MSKLLSPEYTINKQYQLIKLAWNHYQSAPENLDNEVLAALHKQVDVVLRLMVAVLASDEAKTEQVKPQEVEFIIEQLKQQFDNPESFDLSLEQQELTKEALNLAIYQDLLCEKTIESQSQHYPRATYQEAKAYYDKNKARFHHPERRKVSHLLITINDEFAENKRALAEKRIIGIKKQLDNDISQFAELAAKYSECPTSLNQGLVGLVSRGQLYPELELVLFTMEPQTISSVVESEIGLHLLLCHEVYPAGNTPEADAIEAVLKQLNEHRKKKAEKKWVSSLLTVGISR
ncbi:nitrogen fixation protein NifM [Psychromonas sp. PT13]|uniref:nitrogen fixation protein NifM n=1 Tax=Psychromonas sp. PT13 TaxID=3439547 RepID=UPI003EB72E96